MKKLMAMLLTSAVIFASLPVEYAFADEAGANAASEVQETAAQSENGSGEGGSNENGPEKAATEAVTETVGTQEAGKTETDAAGTQEAGKTENETAGTQTAGEAGTDSAKKTADSTDKNTAVKDGTNVSPSVNTLQETAEAGIIEGTEETKKESLTKSAPEYNSFDNARPINVNQTYTGRLSSNTSEQYYKFSIDQPGYVYFYFGHEEVPSPKWNIYLYSADDQLESLLSWETQRFSGDKRYEGTGLPKGTYYVKVTKGRYEYSPLEYRLTVKYSNDGSYETELNDTTNTADGIDLGKIFHGNMRVKNDKDYYKISLSQAGEYNFTFITDADGTPGYHPWRLTVFNANRPELEIIHFSFGPGHEETTKGPVALTAGTYFVRITDPEDNYHLAEPYGFSVNQVTDKVAAFVTRLYKTVLERDPDAGGLAYWTLRLKNGSETGASLISHFFLGDEIKEKHLSNQKYVQLAYQGALGRNPDAEGTAYWVDALDSGTSPQFLVCGCVASQEFNDMCASYGIKTGSISVSEERDKNLGVTKFVSRLYTKALGRNYDTDGLNYWCGIINANPSRDNVIQVAMDGCFHSEEFLNKNLSNRDFVTVAYRTFLGREADQEGYNYWLGQLAGGMSRDEMIRNCAYSQEFSNIMASYGL